MSGWQTMAGAVLAIFGIVGIGAAARRVNWLTAEADETLLKLVIRVLLPALILRVVIGNPRLVHAQNLVLPPLVGFGTLLLGFLVGALVARWAHRPLGLNTPAHRRTFALCVGIYNYGYVPLPLAEQFFGTGTVGVLFVHNIGVEVALWTVGILLLSGGLDRRWWLRLINAPSMAIMAALAINFLHWDGYLPQFVMDSLDLLGRCAIPVGLLLIGATIADHFKESQLHRAGAVMAAACVLRLGLLPAAFLGLAWLLPVSTELQRVMVLQAAMPSAVFPIILARHYRGDAPTAVRIVIGTSLVSLITMPIWIWAGLHLLGMSDAAL
ncbi:MAG TPA: AEC family transporter [Phycisphaeraceae bacterium]